jgi:hypothetical protein
MKQYAGNPSEFSRMFRGFRDLATPVDVTAEALVAPGRREQAMKPKAAS